MLAGSAVLAIVALTGCDPTGTPTPTPTATRSSSPSATTTPTPTATAGDEGGSGGGGAVALACDSIIGPATWAELEGGDLLPTPPDEFFAKIRGEIPAGYVSPWLFFQDNGGIVCTWHNGMEVVAVYGYMDLPADQYPAFHDAMVNSDPYLVEESDAVLFTTQMEGNPFSYVLAGNGPTYVATTLEIIEEMKVLVP
jgi:hypothetical protein